MSENCPPGFLHWDLEWRLNQCECSQCWSRITPGCSNASVPPFLCSLSGLASCQGALVYIHFIFSVWVLVDIKRTACRNWFCVHCMEPWDCWVYVWVPSHLVGWASWWVLAMGPEWLQACVSLARSASQLPCGKGGLRLTLGWCARPTHPDEYISEVHSTCSEIARLCLDVYFVFWFLL